MIARLHPIGIEFLIVLAAMTPFAASQVATGAAEQGWMQFRGPGAMGVAEDPRLPDTWSETENVAWATDIPGLGWSSPIVVGDSIVLTTVISVGDVEAPRGGLYFGGERPVPQDSHRWVVYAIDWNTGEIQWEKQVSSGVPETSRHLKNTFASETPVSDGERIYAYFGNVGLFCLDLEGELLWSRTWDLVRTRFGWGTAASPVLHGDKVYIVNDNDDQSFIVALDKETGETAWRVERDEASNWATPFIWENELRTEIVTAGTGKVRSYDLDGALLWELTGMSSISIPTPFSKFGLLYIASGYVGDRRWRPVYAIRPGASGDISLAADETSNEYIAWFHRLAGPYNPTPIVYGDTYYTLLDRGIFTAHDARTGEVVYGRQRIAAGTGFTASPWAYNGKIFVSSEDGDTFVIQAGPEFEILATNSLGDFTMSTPAITRGSLIIRTASKLYRIAKTGAPVPGGR
jgi:outer membrane protein assembly factor BamB